MKKEWKVYIKGVPNRGDEIIKILTNLGANNDYNYDGYASNYFIYFINHEGNISSASINSEPAKIIMDNYREIKLSEQWEDGTVVFSPLSRTFAVCTEKEDAQWGDVRTHFVLSESAIYYNCCIRKRDYRIANKKERKIFSEWLHKHGKDWDDKNKDLVHWKWKPKDGEDYYYIISNGIVHLSKWFNDKVDNSRFSIGNCFKTKEEAEVMAEKFIKLLKGKS